MHVYLHVDGGGAGLVTAYTYTNIHNISITSSIPSYKRKLYTLAVQSWLRNM